MLDTRNEYGQEGKEEEEGKQEEKNKNKKNRLPTREEE